MEPGFVPMKGAEGWQLSNAPILGMAAHLAALDIFDEVGMDALCKKRDDLTAYLEFVINDVAKECKDICTLEIITPKDLNKRGAQLSILAHGMGKDLFDFMTKKGVIADWREPNVIRIAPVPLYNNYEDVYKFGIILKDGIVATK
jgi:kynureninase